MRPTPSKWLLTLGLLAAPHPIAGQLAEACPGLDEDETALIGFVQDPQLGGMPVFGAVVTAIWEVDGEPRSADTEVPDDGVYLLCGVPQGIEITVQATFSGREGPIVQVTPGAEAARQDLTVSLAGEVSPEDRPLLIGPGSGGRCPDLQAPQLVECVLLDDCRFERLGRVRARRVGSGTDNRELVETFVRNARRMEVDGVRDVRAEWEQRGHEIVLVGLEGTGIEFTEQRCKNWVTNPLGTREDR